MKKIKIVYSSDTHGRVTSYDFVSQKAGPFGITRLSTYLKSVHEPYLLLDNGDYLQGSPLLDYTRKQKDIHPVATMFNALGYRYVTVGNHDFNFGMDVLHDFQHQYKGDILCANIYKDNKPYFKPYVIHDIEGIRVAIIGLTTEYIPFWERKENIEGLEFKDVVQTTKDIIVKDHLKEKADVILCLYHGGFESDMITGKPYGKYTVENKGYALFQIPEIDILLTGHQHISQVHQRSNRVAIQTSHNAYEVGEIDIEVIREDVNPKKLSISARLVKLNAFAVDESKEELLYSSIEKTNAFLSQPVGSITTDMMIHSPISSRAKKHPLFQLVNEIQMAYTNVNISCSSLPNDTYGLPHEVTLRDIFLSFPFENDLVVLEVSGKQLLEALEQNATYFIIDQGQVAVNPSFLIPKVEHYNYDVYDGIDYTMDLTEPMGKRIKEVFVDKKPLDPNRWYQIAMNSYRATGAGGFDMFKDAKKIHVYPVSYTELVSSYIQEHPNLVLILKDNIHIIK